MKIAFLINPIAGLGGTVALKGTDGLADEAIRLGAKPVSPTRAENFFHTLTKSISKVEPVDIQFLTIVSPMGEQILSKFSFKYQTINLIIRDNKTTSQDTINAVKLFEQERVDLIIFVGGDGTSVDVGMTIKHNTPILGIPSGVKTYGSVFTHSPEEAVDVLLSYYKSNATIQAELLDLDEVLYKKGELSISLKGYVRVPAYPIYFQHAKERIEHGESEEPILEAIAEEILDRLQQSKSKKLLIIGTGTTFTPFTKKIGISRSILGVDCIECTEDNKFLSQISDAREDQIYSLMKAYKEIFLLVTPIGGMGYIFGRGNHQLSPRILKEIKRENILIACSLQKLATITDSCLRIDTPNAEFNQSMTGYVRVITNWGENRMVKVLH